MNPEEIAALVVRLTGDGSGYQQMLQQAGQSAQQTAETIGVNARQIEGFGRAIQGYAGAAMSALGSVQAYRFLSGAFEAFQGREVGIVRLSAALRANERDVESTTAEYRRFATQLAATSTASAGQVLGALRAAEGFNLTGAAAERATRNALNLSYAVHGTADSMESMMRLTAKVEEGDLRGAMRFARMIPQLRGVRDETEFLAKYQRLLSAGMFAASDIANSSAGVMAKLGNSYKALRADIGSAVAEGVKPYVRALTDGINWVRGMNSETRTFIVTTLGLAAALLALRPALAALGIVFNIFFGGIGLWGGLIAVAIAGVAAWVASFGGVGRAWDWIKGKGEEFFEWARPMWIAFLGVAEAAWEGVKEVATYVWRIIQLAAIVTLGAIGDLWRRMLGGATIGWNELRDVAVEVLVSLEFTMRRLGPVLELLWLRAGQHFLEFAARVEDWFGHRFLGFLANALEAMGNIGGAAALRLISAVPGMMAGAANAVMLEADKLQNALMEEYLKFRSRRLLEIYAPREAVRAAEIAGEAVGQSFNTGVKRELGKLEGVITGSAESLSRLAAYREANSIFGAPRPTTGRGGGGGGAFGGGGGFAPVAAAPTAANPVPVQAIPPSAQSRVQEEIRDILMTIKTIVVDRLGRGAPALPVALEGVGIVGGDVGGGDF